MNKAFLKYPAAVPVFGTNGLVASHIPLRRFCRVSVNVLRKFVCKRLGCS